MVGATVTSIAQEGRRKGMIGDAGLLVGLGFRLTDVIRLTGGALLYQGLDAAVDDTDITLDPFVSLSLDWDVKETLGGLRDAIF